MPLYLSFFFPSMPVFMSVFTSIEDIFIHFMLVSLEITLASVLFNAQEEGDGGIPPFESFFAIPSVSFNVLGFFCTLEMARDVSHLITNLGYEDAILVGHSMGGKAAMTLALAEPKRVNKLLVVDIAPAGFPFLFCFSPFLLLLYPCYLPLFAF